MLKRKVAIKMGSYMPTNREFDAAEWCLKNKIYINPAQVKNGLALWYIEIEVNNKKNKSKDTFKPIEVWQKKYEYCLYYYNKYKK
jgi:hypothetical protein